MMRTMLSIGVFALIVGTICAFPTPDAIVSEDTLIEEDALAPTGKLDVLENLVRFKAYSLAAYDNARVLANQRQKTSAILEFVLQYGQAGGGVERGGRKAEVTNIVSEYSDLVAQLKNKFGTGVNSYILNNIDHHIRSDPNGVVFHKTNANAFGGGGSEGNKFGRLVALRTKAIGLESVPQVVVDLAAKYPEYLHFKTIASRNSKNADAIAATVFFKSKASGRYKSFLQREVAKVQRRMKQEFDFTAKSAYTAEKDAFKKSFNDDRKAFFKHIAVQPEAGRNAAKKTAQKMPWKPPNYDAMVQIAKVQRDAFMKDFKAKNKALPKMMKEIINEVGGVKLFISTGAVTDAQSTMTPSIKFIGQESSTEGTIRVVPGISDTFVQHFKTEHPLKTIKEVVITAPAGDQKWNCAGSKVRIGGKDGRIISLVTKDKIPQKSFWLTSGNSITLVPDKVELAKNQYEKRQCIKWMATKECDAKAAREPDSDQTCTVTIDSTQAGHCQCDSGSVARVDCGHDSFTCAEMCAS